MSIESSSETSPEFYPENVDLPEPYSPFVPLLILIVALIGWSGYQTFSSYMEGAALRDELKNAQGTIHQAEAAQSRLYSLAQDLVRTGEKDTFAAQIVKDANIQVKPNPNAGSTSAGH